MKQNTDDSYLVLLLATNCWMSTDWVNEWIQPQSLSLKDAQLNRKQNIVICFELWRPVTNVSED